MSSFGYLLSHECDQTVRAGLLSAIGRKRGLIACHQGFAQSGRAVCPSNALCHLLDTRMLQIGIQHVGRLE